MIGAYNPWDMGPKNRHEDSLDCLVARVRHYDRYDSGVLVDPKRPYCPDQQAHASDTRAKPEQEGCSDQN